MRRRTSLLFVLSICSLLASSCNPSHSNVGYVLPTPSVQQTPTILSHVAGLPASEERLIDERPNIIVVMTDDQPYHTVDYMPEVKNFLMANGVFFENAFVTTPVCCPSRASILTGEYAHNHQVYTNSWPLGGATKFDDASTLAVWLQGSGYRTAYYGKYLNGYERLIPTGYVPPGWNDWGAFFERGAKSSEDLGNKEFYLDFSLSENGRIVEYPRAEGNYNADVLTNKALNFINAARDEPFLLFVGYYNPHAPSVPAPRHQDLLRGLKSDWIPYRPPSFNEDDIGDKPEYVGDLPQLSTKEINKRHRSILRSLFSVDDGVASIVDMLAQTKLTERTIIIYLSDNGLTLGDHRFGATKYCPYEACIRVPLVVYAPGYYAPRVDTHLVANIDLAPTIADWAGVPIPAEVDGLSLVGLLENPEAEWREELLLEHWSSLEGYGSLVPEFYSVRTQEWKYTEYVTGEKELYDLISDPYELENLSGLPDYAGIEANLSIILAELKVE